MDDIIKILDNYTKEDYIIFKDTVDMLCKKGVGNGTFQDYNVLVDVIGILSKCEHIIKEKEA